MSSSPTVQLIDKAKQKQSAVQSTNTSFDFQLYGTQIEDLNGAEALELCERVKEIFNLFVVIHVFFYPIVSYFELQLVALNSFE